MLPDREAARTASDTILALTPASWRGPGGASVCRYLIQYAHQLGDEAILVIIPGDGFHQLQIARFGDFRLGGVKDRAKVRADDIGRDNFLLGITEGCIAFRRPFSWRRSRHPR